MKVSKSQALYKHLPGSYIIYNDKDAKSRYACKVTKWNTTFVKNINEDMLKDSIKRRVNSFINAGGKTTFDLNNSFDNLKFVEPIMNEGIPDIYCKVEPCTYYCSKCGRVYFSKNKIIQKCSQCGGNLKTIKQLQMVYACECGYAEGVTPPTFREPMYYNEKGENQYRFYTKDNKKREMYKTCEFCGKEKLKPKNANDSRLFFAQTGNMVNLYNKAYSDLIKKYKTDAEILILAKWFNLLNQEEFDDILENPNDFFKTNNSIYDNPEKLAMAKIMAEKFGQSLDDVIKVIATSEQKMSLQSIKNQLNKIIPISLIGQDNLKLIVSSMIEYDTLKNPKKVITLEEAIKKGLDLQTYTEEDIYEYLNKMKIKNIQVSELVEIINYSFGYTRLRSCPDGTSETQNLCLRNFEDDKVFVNILNTEGILIEFKMLEIYNWLVKNKKVNNIESIDTEEKAKKWFIENIHLDSIQHYSKIEYSENNAVTKIVYSLLHTISHLMIKSAGNLSGLSKDSLSELIFPNECSIFIYPTSHEGVTLGSISGMFVSQLYDFLDHSLNDNEICIFDPICKRTQNAACFACTYLNEVNCTHFNKDLSRAYLYRGEIKEDANIIDIKEGFWR